MKKFNRIILAAITASSASSPALAKNSLVANENGLSLSTTDGAVELSVGGRLHLDASRWKSSTGDGSGARVRRARIELAGRLGKALKFRIDREFSGKGGWRNLWVAIDPSSHFEIRGGNVVVPFSLEELQSSNDSALMERSLLSALVPDYGAGGMVTFHDKHFTISGGYFGNALGSENEHSTVRGQGLTGRVTFAPILEKRTFAHFGLAVEQRQLDDGDRLRFAVKTGTELAPSLFRSPSIGDADRLRTIGAEAAYSAGPLLLQGQFAAMRLDRPSADTDLNAWYAQASFVLTGQRYDYARSTGTVGGVEVGRKGGAIELAARASGIDLKDRGFPGGRGHAFTAGANYYVNRNVRFMLNYAHSEGRDIGLHLSRRTADIVAGRFQVAF